jgi:hypothetical protein
MARVWKIDEVFPFSIKENNRRIENLKIGEIVIKSGEMQWNRRF